MADYLASEYLASEGASVPETGMVTALPAFCMLVGSLATLSMKEPSEQLQACFQNLSAGLLIGAVVTDIFPMLKEQLMDVDDAIGIREAKLACAAIGFFAALWLMYALEGLEEDDEDEEEGAATSSSSAKALGGGELGEALVPRAGEQIGRQEKAQVTSEVASLIQQTGVLQELLKPDAPDRNAVDKQIHALKGTVHATGLRFRGAEDIDARNAMRMRHHASELERDAQKLWSIDPADAEDFGKQLSVVKATLHHIHGHAKRATFRRWAAIRGRQDSKLESEKSMTAPAESGRIPWSLTLAVVIDSGVDGMLIGLASSVNQSSGVLMAIATAIEMGFLGYSFSITLTDAVQRGPGIALIFAPPLTMLLSSITASIGAAAIKDQPTFVALIAFSMVAVLFLVVQELLVEAHEKEGKLGWRVSIWLYLGLFLSMALDIVL